MLTSRHPDYSDEPSTDEPSPELDRLSDIARSAERAAETIQSFIDRFTGSSRLGVAGEKSPPVSGHAGQIERLSKAIQEVDDLSRALRSIG